MDIEKLAKKHEAQFTDWQDGREAEIAFYGGASQLERFAEAYHQAKFNEEIQTLRAKVALADVLGEALKFYANGENYTEGLEIFGAQIHLKDYGQIAQQALATYDKLSEVKHDTK